MSASRPRSGLVLLALLALSGPALAACGGSGGAAASSEKTVVVATHDSWALPKSLLRQFTTKTGYTLKIEENGDAGELTNKLVLTKGSPIADATYGIDNTFGSRAADAGVLAAYTPPDVPASAEKYRLPGAGSHDLTPIDYGDVCVNVDDVWFRTHHLAAPQTFDDLTKPAYKGLFVTEAPTTSSPGLAFLAATIAAKGAGWQAYWKALVANDTKIDPGWSQAYEADFTAGGGHGSRPIVLSYSSSPPDTIPKGQGRPTTSALLDTCFRQVEYAGVLAGASNPKGAQAFVRFMLSKPVQAALPENMYVYPVDASVALPPDWAKWATVSPHPWHVSPQELAAERSTWLTQWRDVATG
ncbi:MAG: thiamine ABC transporter substrate-binding protein [Marmoricola sp.]